MLCEGLEVGVRAGSAMPGNPFLGLGSCFQQIFLSAAAEELPGLSVGGEALTYGRVNSGLGRRGVSELKIPQV